jgi:uncharacterized membrane protein YeaQ/YmgE (transglycosylase-associated protein family)
MEIVWFLLVGLAAGWIAGMLMKGGSMGLVGNLVVGCIGAIIGPYLLGLIGLTAGGLIGQLAAAVVGAVVLLAVLGFIRKR